MENSLSFWDDILHCLKSQPVLTVVRAISLKKSTTKLTGQDAHKSVHKERHKSPKFWQKNCLAHVLNSGNNPKSTSMWWDPMLVYGKFKISCGNLDFVFPCLVLHLRGLHYDINFKLQHLYIRDQSHNHCLSHWKFLCFWTASCLLIAASPKFLKEIYRLNCMRTKLRLNMEKVHTIFILSATLNPGEVKRNQGKTGFFLPTQQQQPPASSHGWLILHLTVPGKRLDFYRCISMPPG